MRNIVRRTKNSILLICLVFLVFSVSPTFAYTMADVDTFMSAVQANPAQYGIDTANGDYVYKEQYAVGTQTGYKVICTKKQSCLRKLYLDDSVARALW